MRQDGVISPFLFLINTNELLWELDSSGLGICVLNIKCGSPAVADDVLLMSFSKFGSKQMLNICYNNSSPVKLFAFLYKVNIQM